MLSNFLHAQLFCSNIDENAPLAILRALIIISSKLLEPPLDGAGFVELMSVMKTLAESSSGCGYVLLFKPATEWLKTWYVPDQLFMHKI